MSEYKILEDSIERLNVNLLYMKKLCLHHNSPLKFFCETCEEPVCQECQLQGPHNNKLHKIISIYESYKKKLNYLNSIVNKQMRIKHDQTMNQIAFLDSITDRVKYIKNNI